MKKLSDYPPEVWDRFFDFITPDVDEMSDAEVKAELERLGIDMKPVHERVRQLIETKRAEKGN